MAILRSLEADDYKARKLSNTWGRYSTSFYKGEKLVHIRTFGSPDRENLSKVSQQLDLNEEMAKRLCKLLKEEFNLN